MFGAASNRSNGSRWENCALASATLYRDFPLSPIALTSSRPSQPDFAGLPGVTAFTCHNSSPSLVMPSKPVADVPAPLRVAQGSFLSFTDPADLRRVEHVIAVARVLVSVG